MADLHHYGPPSAGDAATAHQWNYSQLSGVYKKVRF
jgi:hypothetical protein